MKCSSQHIPCASGECTNTIINCDRYRCPGAWRIHFQRSAEETCDDFMSGIRVHNPMNSSSFYKHFKQLLIPHNDIRRFFKNRPPRRAAFLAVQRCAIRSHHRHHRELHHTTRPEKYATFDPQFENRLVFQLFFPRSKLKRRRRRVIKCPPNRRPLKNIASRKATFNPCNTNPVRAAMQPPSEQVPCIHHVSMHHQENNTHCRHCSRRRPSDGLKHALYGSTYQLPY